MSADLATELLQELKASARRWFIAFIVMIVVEIGTICGFLWYLSLPTVTDTTIEQESDGNNNQMIGGDYNGLQTDDKEKDSKSGES